MILEGKNVTMLPFCYILIINEMDACWQYQKKL